ncbi:DUF2845 domain-containing protein [Modicisalibacter radicis]
MMARYVHVAIVAFLLAISSIARPAHAMRCNGDLVSIGDLTFDVARICGEPKWKQVSPPETINGRIVKGAVRVERWVYGPKNGVYLYLRFVNGELRSIDSQRE